LQVAGVPALCHHWPLAPRFRPPLPGSGRNQLKSSKNKANIKRISRKNQEKIKQTPAIAGNLN
jgi:hypothetical protein